MIITAIMKQHANMICATLKIQVQKQQKIQTKETRGSRREAYAQGELQLTELIANPEKLFKEGFIKKDKEGLEQIKSLQRQFGEFLDADEAMQTAPDLLRQLKTVKDPEVLAQFVKAGVALKLIDSREANEWVEAYGIKIGGPGVRFYPAKSRRVRATASIPID